MSLKWMSSLIHNFKSVKKPYMRVRVNPFSKSSRSKSRRWKDAMKWKSSNPNVKYDIKKGDGGAVGPNGIL